MQAILIAPPMVEPVSLAEAKAWLRVDVNDEDAAILSLISAARALVESATRRALVTQSWRLALDAWPFVGADGGWSILSTRPNATPYEIQLPLAPVQSVSAVRVYDAAGQALPVGHVLRNPAYAEVLRRVAKSGPKAFYEGEVAADIVRRLRAHERPGVMTKTDLAAYRPLERPPMCNTWRELRLCGMGPPSSGHVALMQMLTLLEASAPAAEPEDAWLHRMIAEHPLVASVDPELTWFSRYLPPALGNFEREKHHIDKGDWQQGLPILFTPDEFMQGLRELTGIVYERVLRTRPSATHIVDKHPNYANHMATIARMLPDAKFIHIIRDGRDVGASMVSAAKRQHFGAEEARGAAEDWSRFTSNARKSGKEFGAQRYMEVRYETLLKDDGTLLGSVFDFLGLAVEPAEAAAIVARNAFTKKAVSAADPARKADPNLTWRDRLSLRERYRFDRVAGPLLVELGYARTGWWAMGPLDRLSIALGIPALRMKRALSAAWAAFRQEV